MATDIDNALANLLDTHQPLSVLVIGTEIPAAITAYRADHPECRLCHVTPPDLPQGLDTPGHSDFGIIINTLEHMDKAHAGRLIARLRDLQTSRFYTVIPMGDQWREQKTVWEPSDLIAYGMGLAGQYTDDGKPVHVYKFDINDYKATPDWLNPDHWANPELWDKYRW